MSPASKRRPKDNWDGRIYGLTTIGHGASGLVLELDKNLVVKISTGGSQSLHDINTERRVYQILSKYPQCVNIVKCHDYTHSRGIILERLEGTVRRRVNTQGGVTSQLTALRWILEAATGLAFIHSRGVVQGDVGCHNMLLDRKGTLKLCDFSGSSIHGLEATVGYETRSQAPFEGVQPDKITDRFALGSAMFEICVGHAPYYDLPDYEVTRRYELLDYPIIPEHINSDLAAIIQKCWKKGYSETDTIVQDIGDAITRLEGSTGGKKLSRYRDSTTISESKIRQQKQQQSKTKDYPQHNTRNDTDKGTAIGRSSKDRKRHFLLKFLNP